MACDVGDGPQHEYRRHRQFDRQGGGAEKAANTPRDASESRGEPRRGAAFGLVIQRFERDLEALLNGPLDRAIHRAAHGLGHLRQDAMDRFAGVIGEAGREIVRLQQFIRAREFLFMSRGKLWPRPAHRRRSSGRTPLTLARIAEPLLSSAVNDGLISPLGSARPSASVLRATTMP